MQSAGGTLYLEHVVDVHRQCQANVVVRAAIGGTGHHGAHRRGTLQGGVVDGAQKVLLVQGGETQGFEEPGGTSDRDEELAHTRLEGRSVKAWHQKVKVPSNIFVPTSSPNQLTVNSSTIPLTGRSPYL